MTIQKNTIEYSVTRYNTQEQYDGENWMVEIKLKVTVFDNINIYHCP